MIFTLGLFTFPVKQEEGTDKADVLFFRFRFLESLTSKQTERFLRVLDAWHDRLFKAGLIDYMSYIDDVIGWEDNRTFVEFKIDTCGAERVFSKKLVALLRQVHRISPLKEVEISLA